VIKSLFTIDFDTKTWLIGLFEAEGSLTIAVRGDLQFVITQDYANIAVLYYIRDQIGFGSVIKHGPRTFRYVVQDQEGLGLMIQFLNGNLVLHKRIADLGRFIIAYKIRYYISYTLIETPFKPTLKDAWISGFTDGDGCFHIGYILTKNTFPIRFILSQKDDIEHLRKITGGSIVFNRSNGCYSIVLKDLPLSTGRNTEWVVDYFSKFKLKTTKMNSYYLWCYLRNQLLKKQLTPQQCENMKKLCKLINNPTSDFNMDSEDQ